jgi:uncharacterized caspase-like protein
VCCGSYPNGQNIWPARKNGRDLEAALRVHGFDVQVENDLDGERFVAAVDRFTQRRHGLPNDGRTVGVVYFCGHGMQFEGRNYLLPSGVASDDPRAKDKSISLQEQILAEFPQRYPGLGVAIIDACRDGISHDEKTGACNYSSAPQGCIVAFSASAGQVSLSPSDPNQNSFYTRELVKVLTEVDEEVPDHRHFRVDPPAPGYSWRQPQVKSDSGPRGSCKPSRRASTKRRPAPHLPARRMHSRHFPAASC